MLQISSRGGEGVGNPGEQRQQRWTAALGGGSGGGPVQQGKSQGLQLMACFPGHYSLLEVST